MEVSVRVWHLVVFVRLGLVGVITIDLQALCLFFIMKVLLDGDGSILRHVCSCNITNFCPPLFLSSVLSGGVSCEGETTDASQHHPRIFRLQVNASAPSQLSSAASSSPTSSTVAVADAAPVDCCLLF